MLKIRPKSTQFSNLAFLAMICSLDKLQISHLITKYHAASKLHVHSRNRQLLFICDQFTASTLLNSNFIAEKLANWELRKMYQFQDTEILLQAAIPLWTFDKRKFSVIFLAISIWNVFPRYRRKETHPNYKDKLTDTRSEENQPPPSTTVHIMQAADGRCDKYTKICNIKYFYNC